MRKKRGHEYKQLDSRENTEHNKAAGSRFGTFYSDDEDDSPAIRVTKEGVGWWRNGVGEVVSIPIINISHADSS